MPLRNSEIMRVVNRYIGVAGGYLADFSYRSHADFYPEYCDLDINPYDLGSGTTREKFISILESASTRDQAKIVRGVVERFPVGGPGAPATRTDALRDQLLSVADRLERTAAVGSPPITFDMVERALNDADALTRAQGPSNAVDRLHTALHGYMKEACTSADIPVPADASLTALFKVLRAQHPALQELGARAQDITQVLRAQATILDALNPVRNLASPAHPNTQLLGEAEAVLVINTARTLLHYLEAKLRKADT